MPTPHIFAYLDPGIGSIILQVLVGVVLGGMLMIKLFWQNISSRAKGLFRQSDSEESSDDEPLA